MIIAKYYCDKCKKEIKSKYYRIEINSYKRNIKDNTSDCTSIVVDLCLGCKNDLESFLNRKL